MPDEPASAAETTPQRSGRSQVLIRIAGLAIVGLVLWFLFTRVADWREVWAAIQDLTLSYWGLLIGVALLRFAVEAVLLVAVTPGLSWLRAVPAFLAPAAAASVIPGPSDLAARYAMYRRWGFDATETSSSVILWLIYSTMAKVSLPLIALGLLVFFDRSQARVETVAVIAAGVLVAISVAGFLLLRSERAARRLGRGAGLAAHRIASWFRISTPNTLADDLADRAARFRDQTGRIIRSRSHMAAPGAYAQQAALFAILLVSVRSVGITPDQLDWVAIFAAFALVQIITSVPVTPAGLGVAEVAYVALLAVGSTGGLVDEVTAAALIYRIFSWLIVIPAGGIAWLWWSRTVGEPDMATDPEPPLGASGDGKLP
jgi:uncharacterized protein (TIRG00374 family)